MINANKKRLSPDVPTDNIIKNLVLQYGDSVLLDSKLPSMVADLLQNKSPNTLHLVCLAIQEGIPNTILALKSASEQEQFSKISDIVNKLVNGNRMERDTAVEVVGYFTDALGIKVVSSTKYSEKTVNLHKQLNNEPTDVSVRQEKPSQIPESVKIGDIIHFGNYDWRILDKQADKILLLCEYIITKKAYTYGFGNSWSTCSLRTYLNDEFYNMLLPENRACICKTSVITNDNPWCNRNFGSIKTDDWIYLLSIEETMKFLGDDRQLADGPKDENYSKQYGYYISDQYNSMRMTKDVAGANVWWWLRSKGALSDFAAFVDEKGNVRISGNGLGTEGGVRPAMWVKHKFVPKPKQPTFVPKEKPPVVPPSSPVLQQSSGLSNPLTPRNKTRFMSYNWHVPKLPKDINTALYAEGRNDGVLGTGDIFDKNNGPVKIMDGIIDVAPGCKETLALDKSGNVWNWGIDCLSPKQVGTDAKSIATNRIDDSDWGKEQLGVRHAGTRYAFLTEDNIIKGEGNLPYFNTHIENAKKILFSDYTFFALCENGVLYADVIPLPYDTNAVMGRYIMNILDSYSRTKYDKKYLDSLEVFANNVADVTTYDTNVAILLMDGTVWTWSVISPDRLTYVCDNAIEIKIDFKGFVYIKDIDSRFISYTYDAGGKNDDSPLFDSKVIANNAEGIATTRYNQFWFKKGERVNVGKNYTGTTVSDGSLEIVRVVGGDDSKFYIVNIDKR